MDKLKKKADLQNQGKIKEKWDSINTESSLSTKEKLEKLIKLNIKRKTVCDVRESGPGEEISGDPFFIREFSYPLDSVYKHVGLADWRKISPELLAIISGDGDFGNLDPLKMLYFDVESTGISGGTGTIPFMLGFGFFDSDFFRVKIFILNDLNREAELLDQVDRFLDENEFSATVTYNGKSFDFPLMETRYILYRKRFPLLRKPHLDFLYPARTIWKYTYESRKLGYLGDVLLGISREEDIDPSQIPSLYFSYLRSNRFSLLEKVVEHNALDLLGLSVLLLQGVLYLRDFSTIQDEGEVLGIGRIFEKNGNFEKASELYEMVKQSARRKDVLIKAVRNLSILRKKEKLYKEAIDLWRVLSQFSDHLALKELSIHFEHREKDYYGALEFVNLAIEQMNTTPTQRQDLEKRLKRLQKKIEKLENED